MKLYQHFVCFFISYEPTFRVQRILDKHIHFVLPYINTKSIQFAFVHLHLSSSVASVSVQLSFLIQIW